MIESDICIIGAGPSGMMAAISAAAYSKKIVIFETNTTAGRKLLLTGRGRCNLTHTGNPDEIIRAFKPFDRFVRHCIYEYPPQKLLNFFLGRGLNTVIEEDGCIFPSTHSSTDVNNVLIQELQNKQVQIYYGRKIANIERQNDLFIVPTEKVTVSAKNLIIATGGVSWPQTGSTGDGYNFASNFGHNIIKPAAAIVPLIAEEKFCRDLAGMGIPNVTISCKIGDKKIIDRGPMIFTHSGIGGPAVFDLSRNIAGLLEKDYKVFIDFLPDTNIDELDRKLSELIAQSPKKNMAQILSNFFPKTLAGVICKENDVPEIEVGQINKKIRRNIAEKIKNYPFNIVSAQDIERATVTRGGVDIAQIDSKTMQSKIVHGLFFAGEVMNVDGPCGGYNLQFAFSSGFISGKSAAQRLE